MGSLIILLPIISIMIGLYFTALGLWELRKGENRKLYIKYMFTGLFLLFVLSPLIWVYGNIFAFQFS